MSTPDRQLKISILTEADTTGIRQTKEEMQSLEQQSSDFQTETRKIGAEEKQRLTDSVEWHAKQRAGIEEVNASLGKTAPAAQGAGQGMAASAKNIAGVVGGAMAIKEVFFASVSAIKDMIGELEKVSPEAAKQFGGMKEAIEWMESPIKKFIGWASGADKEIKALKESQDNAKRSFGEWKDVMVSDAKQIENSMNAAHDAVEKAVKAEAAARRVDTAQSEIGRDRAVAAGSMTPGQAETERAAQAAMNAADTIVGGVKNAEADFNKMAGALVTAEQKLAGFKDNPMTSPEQLAEAEANVQTAKDALKKAGDVLADVKLEGSTKIEELAVQINKDTIKTRTETAAKITEGYQEVRDELAAKVAQEGDKASTGAKQVIDLLTSMLTDSIPDEQQVTKFKDAMALLNTTQEGRTLQMLNLVAKATTNSDATLTRLQQVENDMDNLQRRINEVAARNGVRVNTR